MLYRGFHNLVRLWMLTIIQLWSSGSSDSSSGGPFLPDYSGQISFGLSLSSVAFKESLLGKWSILGLNLFLDRVQMSHASIKTADSHRFIGSKKLPKITEHHSDEYWEQQTRNSTWKQLSQPMDFRNYVESAPTLRQLLSRLVIFLTRKNLELWRKQSTRMKTLWNWD